MTVLLSVAAVLMYASTLRASLLQRLVLSKKILRIMLVFLRTYCVTARSLRYSHTSVCSVPRNSRAL